MGNQVIKAEGLKISLLRKTIIILFIVMVFFSFISPVDDPDTPWHLETGQYILTHRVIPASDPFTFAEDDITPFGEFILSQSWLAQIIMVSVLNKAGVFGLVLMKAFIFTLLVGTVWLLLGGSRSGFYLPIAILGSVVIGTIEPYSSVRPQMFTFLFSGLLLFLLERWRVTRQKAYLMALPLLILFWTNMHGGVIFGVVIISIYILILEVSRISSTSRDGYPIENHKVLLTLGLISIMVYLINPNGYGAFKYALITHTKDFYTGLVEYRTPLSVTMNETLFLRGGAFYWGLVTLSLFMIIFFFIKRLWIPSAILTFAGLLGLSAIRYIPLFGITLAVTAAHVPLGMIEEKLSVHSRKVIDVLMVMAFCFVAYNTYPFNNPEIYKFSDNFIYPANAGSFLGENRISGNIFVSYNKSGYILFSQYPGSRIYFDARFVDPERTWKGAHISGESVSNGEYIMVINRTVPLKKGNLIVSIDGEQKGEKLEGLTPENRADLLEEIHAEIVVHEAISILTGRIYPLVLDLIRDNRWKLIYLDGNVTIFVRDTEKFRKAINMYAKPKEFVFDEIVQEARQGFESGRLEYYNSVAAALLLKGLADYKVETIIRRVLNSAPGNPTAGYLLERYKLSNPLE